MRRSSLLPIALLLAVCGCSSNSGDQTTTSGSPGGASNGGEGGVGAGATSEGGGGDGQGASHQGGNHQGGSGSSTGTTGTTGSPGEKRIIGYYTAWSVYARDYHVPEIPAELLTHINYAFANISEAGECVMGDAYADSDKYYPGDSWDAGAKRGSFHQLELLKAAHPKLRTLISVGGWTWSGRFSDVALTAQSRSKFVGSCVAFMKQWGFDGVDIDWEYPVSGGLESNTYRPEDKQNYTLLLQDFRAALDAQGSTDGKTYELSIAAPAGPGTYANLELQGVAAAVDWINLMAYDFHGGWDPVTNFNAALKASSSDPSADPAVKTQFNVVAAVEGYLAGGVPADKLVLGTPSYGRGFAGVGNQDHGLYRPFSGLSQGTWEPGSLDYHDIVANYLPKMTRYWHEEAQVPWLYDDATGVMISYDDPESMQKKADVVLQKDLGGAMFWELSGDTADHALLEVLHGSLGSN